MKRFIVNFLFVAFLFTACVALSASATAASDVFIQPYAYREELPVSYEIWYSYRYHEEERHFVYKPFTYLNGYHRSETFEKMELTPLEYEFYAWAKKVTIHYSFY